jgi:type IV pilus assembly protein PilA
MLIKLRERMGREEGFTLIELLVVMLILGILAAIAIPAFFNQRDKARDADAKVGARTAQTAMETYATDHGGSYGTVPADTEAALIVIEPTLAADDLTVAYPEDEAYSVTYDSTSGNTFTITVNTDGVGSASCATPGVDGCPSPAPGNWFGDSA